MNPSKAWTEYESMWIYRFTDYNLKSLNDTDTRKKWLIEVVQGLLDILHPFASPNKVEVGTLSIGEEAFVINCKEKGFQKQLKSYLSENDDVTDIHFYLSLHCYEVFSDHSLKKITLENGGTLSLFVELDIDKKLIHDAQNDPIWLSFDMDFDIYAPLLMSTPQSREMARINAPLLKNFLTTMQHRFSLEQTYVTGPPYLLDYLEKI
ncbi:MAG: hypothetical protein C0P67_008790 [Bacillota bacterium]